MKQAAEEQLEEAKPVEQLDRAACYFPLANGRYEVKPGLVKFGADFGNGKVDQQVFQIDENFAHYRQMKQLARRERLSKYFQTCNFSEAVERPIAKFMIDRLTQEHPQIFQQRSHQDGLRLHNQLTEETLLFSSSYELQQIDSHANPGSVVYISALDALANQVQEDITIVSRVAEQHWVSAIHLCFPNHWAAAAKIGQAFAHVHAPVPGMDGMNRRGEAIVNTMITHHPTVRFAWGLSTDTRLNHHPEPPSTVPAAQWSGRSFNPADPRLYLRIERQVVWGFPAVNAAVFTIRTYFRDCHVLKQDINLRTQLTAAIRSMAPQSLLYKGLEINQAAILEWLEDT